MLLLIYQLRAIQVQEEPNLIKQKNGIMFERGNSVVKLSMKENNFQ